MKHNGQCERLLIHLKAGKTIDGIRSWQQLGIYRLASRVCDLRKSGWDVQSRWIKGTNRFKEKVQWKEYFIDTTRAHIEY